MIYKVYLTSRDNQVYVFTCEADKEATAVTKALDKIRDKGWGSYEYKFTFIEEIHVPQNEPEDDLSGIKISKNPTDSLWSRIKRFFSL